MLRPPLTDFFEPYPAYKPSNVEWLGNVPAHWEIRLKARELVKCGGKARRARYGPPRVVLGVSEDDAGYVGVERLRALPTPAYDGLPPCPALDVEAVPAAAT